MPDAYTLSALIMACQAHNYWEEAMEVTARFRAEHGVLLTTRACNALIATLGKAGRWQYALQVPFNSPAILSLPESAWSPFLHTVCFAGQWRALVRSC